MPQADVVRMNESFFGDDMIEEKQCEDEKDLEDEKVAQKMNKANK